MLLTSIFTLKLDVKSRHANVSCKHSLRSLRYRVKRVGKINEKLLQKQIFLCAAHYSPFKKNNWSLLLAPWSLVRWSLILFFAARNRSLAEVHFLIDSCRLVSQSNKLNNCNRDCDWLILKGFPREQSTVDATYTPLKKSLLCFTLQAEPFLTVDKRKRWKRLCSQGGFDHVSCFTLHFFHALPFSEWFTTDQNTAEASLFVK